MTRDRNHFEDYSVLSEIKLSPTDREDIWHGIEQGMEQDIEQDMKPDRKRTHIHTTKRGITMMKTSAAIVAALALFGGGIAYEVHHTGSSTKSGITTASRPQSHPHPKVPTPTSNKPSQSNYTSEIALIKGRGYSVNETTPNATVKTASGDTLAAWNTTATQSQDGYNQFVFFFLNGKYLGTDTAKPSLQIRSVKAAGNGIAVTYPVYKKNDSFANPTGTPVTITYTWNGSKLVPNKPYPKQFQGSGTTTQGNNPISTKSYATSAEAASQIASIQGGAASGIPVSLGHGIIAKESAGMGHARYEWQEGNWAIQIRYFTKDRGVKQVAENMVSYLNTHMLPAPNTHGVIVVNNTDANTASFKPKTIIAWQEGTKVNELQQTGNPIQALQTVVNHK